MNNPAYMLLIGVLIIAGIFVLILLWKKFSEKLKGLRNNKKKILAEDALKYLYNCEYNSITCSVEGIAGNLSIPAADTVEVVDKLERMGLINLNQNNLMLTDEGRQYALRIIRVHRLWERYLADETGMKETDWHISAEMIEHRMDIEQADALAAQIGNPVFDPHGDPIPTSSGEIPVRRGEPVSSLKPGEHAQIIHIEDEPHYIYTRLSSEGLYAGMQLRMEGIKHNRITFSANGKKITLPSLFAHNITVAPIRSEERLHGKFKTLTDLKKGESGIVLGISKACRGQQRRRMMDLGIVPGSEISVEMKSIGGDPVAYRIKGSLIALRKDQADKIFLKSDSVKLSADKEEIKHVIN